MLPGRLPAIWPADVTRDATVEPDLIPQQPFD